MKGKHLRSGPPRVNAKFVAVWIAAGATGCSRPAAPISTAKSTVPLVLYALVANPGGMGDMRHASTAQIKKYLDDEAKFSSTTDAQQLYACRWKKGAPSFPVFTHLDRAKKFVDHIYHVHRTDKRPTSVIVMTVVEINDSGLYDRTSTRTDVGSILLDPSFADERTIRPVDLIQSADAVAPPAITDRQMVWVSDKNSNVDKTE